MRRRRQDVGSTAWGSPSPGRPALNRRDSALPGSPGLRDRRS